VRQNINKTDIRGGGQKRKSNLSISLPSCLRGENANRFRKKLGWTYVHNNRSGSSKGNNVVVVVAFTCERKLHQRIKGRFKNVDLERRQVTTRKSRKVKKMPREKAMRKWLSPKKN
jgi:hypothetical protein